MAKDGYKFIGFTTLNGAAFDFNSEITKATTIYAFYDKVTVYHTLANADDNIFKEDFNSKTASDTVEKIVDYGTKGIYAGGSGAASLVKFSSYKATVEGDGTNAGELVVDLGESISNSVLTMTFELEFSGYNNFMFMKLSSADTSKPAFGLCMQGSNNDRKLRYRTYNGDAAINEDTTTALESAKTYIFEVKLDLATKKVNVKVNGTQVAEMNDIVLAYIPDSIQGLCLDSAKASSDLTVNNIAVNKEGSTLEAIKAGAKAALQKSYDAIVETDYVDATTDPTFDTLWAPVLAAKTAGDTAIDAAENATVALEARDTAITAVNTALSTLRNTMIESLTNTTDGGITTWNYADDASNLIKEKYASLDETTTPKKSVVDSGLAELKAQFVVDGKVKYKKADDTFAEVTNIKDGYTAFAQFESAAEGLVAEKVDVTVKYMKYDYVEATGVTSWASKTDYYVYDYTYTEAKNVTQASIDSGTKYYNAKHTYEAVENLTDYKSGTTYYTKDGDNYIKSPFITKFDSKKTYYTKNGDDYTQVTTSFDKTVEYYTEASGVYTLVHSPFDSSKTYYTDYITYELVETPEAGKSYYTQSEEKTYQKINLNVIRAPKTGITYYTYSPVEIANTSKTFKTAKGYTTNKANIEALDGYFLIEYYKDANFANKFVFETDTITTDDATIYVYVEKKLVMDIASVPSSAISSGEQLINQIFYIGTRIKTESLKSPATSSTAPFARNITTTAECKSDQGYIKFTVDSDITVTILAATKGGDSDAQQLRILKSDGTAATLTNIKVNGTAANDLGNLSKTAVTKYEFTLSAGTYLVGGDGNNAYIYSLEITK